MHYLMFFCVLNEIQTHFSFVFFSVELFWRDWDISKQNVNDTLFYYYLLRVRFDGFWSRQCQPGFFGMPLYFRFYCPASVRMLPDDHVSAIGQQGIIHFEVDGSLFPINAAGGLPPPSLVRPAPR